MTIDTVNVERLLKLNLNLMPSLYALLDTKSVSAAALMLKVSQPTMSRNLGQLREAFEDDLLVRVNGRCSLTVKAQKLFPLAKQLVNSVENLAKMTTSPAEDYRYIMAMPQYVIERYSSQLMSSLYQAELGRRVVLKASDGNTFKRVLDGDYDLAILPQKQGEKCKNDKGVVYSEQVITSVMGVLVSESHPLALRKMTCSDFAQYPLYSLSNTLDGFFSDYRNSYQLGRIDKTVYPAFSVLRGMMQSGHGMLLTTGLYAYSTEGYTYEPSERLQVVNRENEYPVANGAMIVSNNSVKDRGNAHGLVFRALPGEHYVLENRVVWPRQWDDNLEHGRLRKTYLEFLLTICAISATV